MVLYFFVMSCCVSGSLRTMKKWELRRLRQSGGHTMDAIADPEAMEYVHHRSYFIRNLMPRFKQVDETEYNRALEYFGIAGQQDAEDKFKKRLEDEFSFSAYLA